MVPLDRGAFVISIDFELIWGTLDLFGPEKFRKLCEIEREQVIDRLLDLFVEFEVPATWCVLGHLFLDGCAAENGLKHPEMIRPSHSWCEQDWFEHDPMDKHEGDSIFLGRSLVEKIRSCPVPQEVGCHSFSHVILGDEGCSRETAESEISACVRLAQQMNIDLRSFAFPRNSVGHLEVLREHGFICFRGPEPHWYERRSWPKAVRRLAHLLDVLAAAAPPVMLPQPAPGGLWNLPGSMIYFPMHGLRRYIPISLRVKRAIKGLDSAAREKRVFHLWFHPTNLADQMDTMFSGLRAILDYAARLRDLGDLEILPMGQLALASSSMLPARPLAGARVPGY